MCLDKVTSKYVFKGFKIGHKVTRTKYDNDGTRIGVEEVLDGFVSQVKFDEWQTVKNPGAILQNRNKTSEYMCGFHILKTREDAEYLLKTLAGKYPTTYRGCGIFECEYAGILANGTEKENMGIKRSIRVVVAAMIKINLPT